MRKYEIIYIIPSKYTDAEMEGVVAQVNSILKESGAEVSDTYQLGKRRLAYPIANQRNGSYVLTHFEAEPKSLLKVEQTLRLTDEVLRHMIVERNPLLTQIPKFTETDERRGEESRPYERRTAPVAAKPAPVKPKEVNIEELDKKLDEILTEEVL